ncbi:hypothetical protein [Pseudoalteromonas luteoviolacea]|uniref:Uncharacterized protein n=1 Tax=Pseudoalteromonas luteoviolacea NCIMB 1942 TaxID=1365253 RepID=A0A167B029_9GAMM|nr:hypothetical protein [Pseudoalteromonas luteoviolacea]KZN46004.1 hypothetical protein N482_13070 [Pseudoalteromonas luteoviolacea NCIMB 1942]
MRIAHFNELTNVRSAAGSDADYDAISHQVARGVALLVESNGCYCVLRLDPDGLCVVCAAGKHLLKIAPCIVKLAVHHNAPSIIFHTRRPALARHLSAYNFKYEMTDKNGYLVFRMRSDDYGL